MYHTTAQGDVRQIGMYAVQSSNGIVHVFYEDQKKIIQELEQLKSKRHVSGGLNGDPV